MPSRQYGHRLRARRARETVAEEIREPLVETADGMRDDVREDAS